MLDSVVSVSCWTGEGIFRARSRSLFKQMIDVLSGRSLSCTPSDNEGAVFAHLSILRATGPIQALSLIQAALIYVSVSDFLDRFGCVAMSLRLWMRQVLIHSCRQQPML